MDDNNFYLWVNILGSLVTLTLTMILGVKKQNKQMFLMILACAICFGFVNIDKIDLIKTSVFEAKMKNVLQEANASLDQLQLIALSSTKVFLANIMGGNFYSGLSIEEQLEIHDDLIKKLKDIGVKQDKIDSIENTWSRGINCLFTRAIQNILETEINQAAIEDEKTRIQNVSNEIRELLNASKLSAPNSYQIRQLMIKNNVMNEQIDELLKDYSQYENDGSFRRKDVFISSLDGR